jgi:hypothetical protein
MFVYFPLNIRWSADPLNSPWKSVDRLVRWIALECRFSIRWISVDQLVRWTLLECPSVKYPWIYVELLNSWSCWNQFYFHLDKKIYFTVTCYPLCRLCCAVILFWNVWFILQKRRREFEWYVGKTASLCSKLDGDLVQRAEQIFCWAPSSH